VISRIGRERVVSVTPSTKYSADAGFNLRSGLTPRHKAEGSHQAEWVGGFPNLLFCFDQEYISVGDTRNKSVEA
jgi:hypothetical protein